MGNYKAKDYIVIIISTVVFIGALIFLLESLGGNKKAGETASAKEEVPPFVSEYDNDTYNKIKGYRDYGSPDPTNTCKNDLFVSETGQGSCALSTEQTIEKINFSFTDKSILNTEDRRNAERKNIANFAKQAIANYYKANMDNPASSTDMEMISMLTSTAMAPYVNISGTPDDPSESTSRLCYVRKSDKQYYLYIVKEPASAPSGCEDKDPALITGVEDFSLR